MTTVTAPGSASGAPPISFTFDPGAGLQTAQQIANDLSGAVTAGTLTVTTVSGSGAVPAPGGGGVQELLVEGPLTATVPAGYNYVVNNASAAITISAASNTAILSGGFGGSFTETGSATIVASGGSNVISQSGAGSVVLMGGSGNDTIIAAGTGTIDGGGGNNFIVASGSGVVIRSDGNDTISATGAAATISLAGGGSDVVVAGAGHDTVMAGPGKATVLGSPGSDITYNSTGSVGSAFLVAGAGNETINAAGSHQSLFMAAGAGSDVLIAGSGNDTVINGNGGSTTMTGGAGSDLFAFFKSNVIGAKDVVTDFTVADLVIVNGYATTGSASALVNAATVDAGGVTLTLSDGTTVTFSNLTSATQLNGRVQYDGSGAVCYARGTRIRTPAGEPPIEKLRPGKQVITLVDGKEIPRTVTWLGHRRIDLTRHLRPETVAPIRIERDAIAEGMPHRDLMVSPDHAIFVDGMLICARQLVNGTTIRQECDRRAVHYYHVELDEHAILLAEGLPAESYLDTGNSGFFANSEVPLVLHPDLTDETDYPTREAGSCAPFVWDAANVQPVWQRLADRAAAIGRPVPTRVIATDAALRVLANQRMVKPVVSDSDHVIFVLPRDVHEVRLLSRAQSPTEARPWLEDRRRLGVRVKRIVLRGADDVREVPVDHPDLTQGWWAVERDGQMISRWTDGEAVLPLPALRGIVMLEIRLAGAMTFVEDAVPVGGTGRRAAA